jgi:N-acetylglutamate synthase-like GNAT family acetyltransferase
LNLEWLERYGLTEEPDLIMINNPQEEIINTGGFIFLAKSGNEVVGTAALIKESPTQFELVKMAVSPLFQGTGISRLLMEKCLQAARESGAKRIYLQSNSQLTTAIALYEKYGFKHIPVKDAHYITADVMMELLL